MIRFLLYYFVVILYRCIRFIIRIVGWLFPFLRRFCPTITGDNNYLATPLLTLDKIMNDEIIKDYSYYVDIGCGEGLAGLYMRLIKGKVVVLHDVQQHFLYFIQWVTRLLFISNVNVRLLYQKIYPESTVFLCVWTSWSTFNREKTVQAMSAILPRGGTFISVTHPVIHPMFVLAKKVDHMFAWGKSTVYYYYHA